MPIYTYENQHPDRHCTYCLGGFDVLQKMADPVLTHCPHCGHSIKKVIKAVNLQQDLTASPNTTLSEKNIAKHGFTQYRKTGPGQYEKTAGRGPDTLDGDND